MALFPEKSGIGNVDAPGSEDPTGHASNSLPPTATPLDKRRGTSAPTRPERQGNEAGPAVDKQLQARAPWIHADLGCSATAAALCSKEH